MQSDDRLADFLRTYVREEAPPELWQVVSAELSTVLRKVITLSAECQRAKLQLDRLRRAATPPDEDSTASVQLRRNLIQNIHDAKGNVEMHATVIQTSESEGFTLSPGQSVRLPPSRKREIKRPFLHWCKVCNELSRSHQADPAICPRRECRSAFWRTGKY